MTARQQGRKARDRQQRAEAAPAPKVGPVRPSAWAWGLAVLLVVAATWVAYVPALDNDFVAWDDPEYTTENKLILERSAAHDALLWRTPVSLNYHPLTMWSLAWDAGRARRPDGTLKAGPFIRTNVVLHALNALLVLGLVWLLVPGGPFVALIAALLFAVHPMHVESVAWVSERKDVLHAFFFLLALLAYLRHVDTRQDAQPHPWWLPVALVFFIAACLSKAMAVSLAPLVVLIDLWRGRRFTLGPVLEKVPFFAIALFFGLMALDVQRGGDFHGLLTLSSARANSIAEVYPYTLWDRITFGGFGFTQYIIRFLAPFGLCTYYPYPSDADLQGALAWRYGASAVFMVACIVGAVWWAIRRKNMLAFGMLFFAVTVALVLQFIPVGQVIMADRYTYIPYIGLSLLVVVPIGALAAHGMPWRVVAWSGAATFVLFLLVLTRRQADTWQDSEALWGRVLELYPHATQPRVNLGNHYGKSGQVDKAIACFERAVQDGARNGAVFEGLGNAFGTKGDHAKAEEMFSRSIKAEPFRGSYYMNRGTSRLSQQKYEAAIADYDRALELEGMGRTPAILARRAYCLMMLGRYTDAGAAYDRSIALGHHDPLSYFYRAQTRHLSGDTRGALDDLQQALRLRPDFPEARQLVDRYGGGL